MKFVFVYYNHGAWPTDEQKVKDSWMEWFKGLGDKIVDGGNPMGNGMAVTAEGAEKIDIKEGASGYTIIEAADMAEAIEIAKGNPLHGDTDGKGTIRVYEAMAM